MNYIEKKLESESGQEINYFTLYRVGEIALNKPTVIMLKGASTLELLAIGRFGMEINYIVENPIEIISTPLDGISLNDAVAQIIIADEKSVLFGGLFKEGE